MQNTIMPENVRFIIIGSEDLQTGMVDENRAAVVRVRDLPKETQHQLIKHLYE